MITLRWREKHVPAQYVIPPGSGQPWYDSPRQGGLKVTIKRILPSGQDWGKYICLLSSYGGKTKKNAYASKWVRWLVNTLKRTDLIDRFR